VLKTTGTPLKLSETPGQIPWLAPQPGEHNEGVFVGLLGHSRDGPGALARGGRDLVS
jgi:crotonobetainyl-CoA:carnitine CoA-transferase CaiB-like acyl-CoA transferase